MPPIAIARRFVATPAWQQSISPGRRCRQVQRLDRRWSRRRCGLVMPNERTRGIARASHGAKTGSARDRI